MIAVDESWSIKVNKERCLWPIRDRHAFRAELGLHAVKQAAPEPVILALSKTDRFRHSARKPTEQRMHRVAPKRVVSCCVRVRSARHHGMAEELNVMNDAFVSVICVYGRRLRCRHCL